MYFKPSGPTAGTEVIYHLLCLCCSLAAILYLQQFPNKCMLKTENSTRGLGQRYTMFYFIVDFSIILYMYLSEASMSHII